MFRCAAPLTLLVVSLTPHVAAQVDTIPAQVDSIPAQADTTALPDSTTEDVIHFKSGDTLRGRILDSETTKGSLLIRTRDGRDVRISRDQVARVVRGQRPGTSGAAKAISSTSSQSPAGSQAGFWMGLGSGWGSTGISCSACTNERFGGVSGYVSAGVTVTPNVLLGGEFTGWWTSQVGADEHMTFFTLVGLFYPEPAGGFYLKGGLGAMWYAGDDGTVEITATAPAVIIGAGYEFRLGPTLVLSPFLHYFTTTNAKFELNGQSPGDAEIKFNLLQLGAGIAWCMAQ